MRETNSVSPRSRSPNKIISSPSTVSPSSQEFVSIIHAPGAQVMPLNAFMTTNIPGEKHRLFKSEWRDRFVVFEKNSDGNFVILVYKATSSSDDRGALRQTIALTPTSDILIKNEILKSAPWFRYLFVVDQGCLIQFALTTESVRNRWASTLRSYIEELRGKQHDSEIGSRQEVKADNYLTIDVQSPFSVGGSTSGIEYRLDATPSRGSPTSPVNASSRPSNPINIQNSSPADVNRSIELSGGPAGNTQQDMEGSIDETNDLVARNYEISLEGVLLCKLSSDISDEGWSELYCVFEQGHQGSAEFSVLDIYDSSSKRSKKNRGELLRRIHFTAATTVSVENESIVSIHSNGGIDYRYYFAIVDEGSIQCQFLCRNEMSRNTWTLVATACIGNLQSNIDYEEKKYMDQETRGNGVMGVASEASAVFERDHVSAQVGNSVDYRVEFDDYPTYDWDARSGEVVLLDCLMDTNWAFSDDWMSRYVLLSKSKDGLFAVLIYEPELVNPTPSDRGILSKVILIESNSLVFTKNDVSDTSIGTAHTAYARYIFAVESGDVLYQFCVGIEDVRDYWIDTIRKCINRLKKNQSQIKSLSKTSLKNELEGSGRTDEAPADMHTSDTIDAGLGSEGRSLLAVFNEVAAEENRLKAEANIHTIFPPAPNASDTISELDLSMEGNAVSFDVLGSHRHTASAPLPPRPPMRNTGLSSKQRSEHSHKEATDPIDCSNKDLNHKGSRDSSDVSVDVVTLDKAGPEKPSSITIGISLEEHTEAIEELKNKLAEVESKHTVDVAERNATINQLRIDITDLKANETKANSTLDKLRAAVIVEASRTQSALNQLFELTTKQQETDDRHKDEIKTRDGIIDMLQQEVSSLKMEYAKAISTQEKLRAAVVVEMGRSQEALNKLQKAEQSLEQVTFAQKGHEKEMALKQAELDSERHSALELLQRTLHKIHFNRESEMIALHAEEISSLQKQYDEDLINAVMQERERFETTLRRDRDKSEKEIIRLEEEVCTLMEEVAKLKAERRKGDDIRFRHTGSSHDITLTPPGSCNTSDGGSRNASKSNGSKTTPTSSRKLMF